MENNPIPLKTSNCFNYHDFIHTESGTTEELTVEITLSEYRELVGKAATTDVMLDQIGRDYAELSEKYGNAQASMDEMEKVLTDEKENSDLYLRNNADLRAEIERQNVIIADLKTRLAREIKSQDFEKEDAT